MPPSPTRRKSPDNLKSPARRLGFTKAPPGSLHDHSSGGTIRPWSAPEVVSSSVSASCEGGVTVEGRRDQLGSILEEWEGDDVRSSLTTAGVAADVVSARGKAREQSLQKQEERREEEGREEEGKEEGREEKRTEERREEERRVEHAAAIKGERTESSSAAEMEAKEETASLSSEKMEQEDSSAIVVQVNSWSDSTAMTRTEEEETVPAGYSSNKELAKERELQNFKASSRSELAMDSLGKEVSSSSEELAKSGDLQSLRDSSNSGLTMGSLHVGAKIVSSSSEELAKPAGEGEFQDSSRSELATDSLGKEIFSSTPASRSGETVLNRVHMDAEFGASGHEFDKCSVTSLASLPEGVFTGEARHKDGSLMAIIFQVCVCPEVLGCHMTGENVLTWGLFLRSLIR